MQRRTPRHISASVCRTSRKTGLSSLFRLENRVFDAATRSAYPARESISRWYSASFVLTAEDKRRSGTRSIVWIENVGRRGQGRAQPLLLVHFLFGEALVDLLEVQAGQTIQKLVRRR